MNVSLKRTTPFVFGSIAVAAAVAVLGSGASAQDPGSRTLTFKALEKGATFAHVRNTKPASRRANPTGDVIVFTNPIAAASGEVVGKLFASCTTTVGARNFLRSTTTCSGVMSLRNGTITLQANSKPGVPRTIGAVTGGSGAYMGARGAFVSEEESGDLTVTLVE